MLYYIAALVVSFVITLIAGHFLIPALAAMKAGQTIREIGPKWHMSKQGTPTMGGLCFIFAILVTTLTVGWRANAEGGFAGFIVIGLSLLFGVIGFADDYVKVKKKRNLGLTSLQKLVMQLAVALIFIYIMFRMGHLDTALYVPFLGISLRLHPIVYMVLAAFIVVGTVNAVNLTDGVDGLASGVTVPVAVFFAATAALWQSGSVGVLASALVGGLLGFLVYNFHPAKVFMGDTGSLFLGGMVCGMAFALDVPLALVPVGIIYIAEAMSDIIQVTYFKLSGGKRIFRMAPLHHHFEMGGWSEKKIFAVFTIITAVFCVLAYLGVRGR